MPIVFTTELMDHGDGEYSLAIGPQDDATVSYFQERGLEGNGYTWDGLVQAIARSQLGDAVAELSFTPEADDLLVSASDQRLLTALADALAEACDDDEELERAIESADHIE